MQTSTASEQDFRLDQKRDANEKEGTVRGINSYQLNNEGVLMAFPIITRPAISRHWVTIHHS